MGIVPVTISPAVGDVAYNSLRSTEVSIVAHQPIEADVVASMTTKELASYTREIINKGLPII